MQLSSIRKILLLAISSLFLQSTSQAFADGAEVGGGGNLSYVELRTRIDLINQLLTQADAFASTAFIDIKMSKLALAQEKMSHVRVNFLETEHEIPRNATSSFADPLRKEGIVIRRTNSEDSNSATITILISRLVSIFDEPHLAAGHYLEALADHLDLDQEVVDAVAANISEVP